MTQQVRATFIVRGRTYSALQDAMQATINDFIGTSGLVAALETQGPVSVDHFEQVAMGYADDTLTDRAVYSMTATYVIDVPATPVDPATPTTGTDPTVAPTV